MPGLLQPEQRVGAGRFTLLKPVGRGGMGEVWLARDERLHEPVALKFLPPEIRGDPGALDDLRRETARSHKLSHPNIVRIHDLHEDADGTAFIVMEYVDGPTLAAVRLEQSSRVLSWYYLRPLVAQLCAALEYAHGEKVIHRDLKPANLMVDSRGRLKLADFGIAAVASDSMSRISVRHSTSGTLPYMSPQQVAGKRPQAADDIYALGATLYELLTSKLPFHGGDITHQILHVSPPPMKETMAAFGTQNEIPPDAAWLIMACLAKEPGQRPQSARAVAEWIGLELDAKPTTVSLAAALFPQTPSGSGPAVDEPAEMGRSRPARFGRNLAAVGIVVLVMAGAFWLRKDSLHRGYPNAPVTTAKAPAQTEPASELQAPPVGAPPEAALSPQEATSRPAIPTESLAKPQVPQKIKTEEPAIIYSDFPADLQPALDKLVENMKKQGGFCIAGRVTFSDGAPVEGGDQLQINYRNGIDEPLAVYSNGWFMGRRPLGANYIKVNGGHIFVRSFLYDPVDLSVAPHTDEITYVAVELHRTPRQNLTTIQGRVGDEHGAPIRGAGVRLQFSMSTGGPSPFKQISTQGDGKFAFSELAPASNYEIYVSFPGRAYETAMLSTHAGQVFDTNMTLYPGRTITFDYVCQTNGTRDFTDPGVLRGTRSLGIPDSGLNFVKPKNQWSQDLHLEQIQNKLSFRCSYGGTNGNGFYDAGAVGFDSITEAPEKGYSMQRKDCVVGHVYVVKTYDGYYAKLIVKTD